MGANGSGQLGIGTTDVNPHPSPVLVRTLAGGSLAAAGEDDVMMVASPAPRIPSVTDETQAGVAQVLQAAGYVLGPAATVVDITCQYVGVVKTQSPVAGPSPRLAPASLWRSEGGRQMPRLAAIAGRRSP